LKGATPVKVTFQACWKCSMTSARYATNSGRRSRAMFCAPFLFPATSPLMVIQAGGEYETASASARALQGPKQHRPLLRVCGPVAGRVRGRAEPGDPVEGQRGQELALGGSSPPGMT